MPASPAMLALLDVATVAATPASGAVDLIIAATALELSAPLATINVRHFPMFEGLRSPY